MLPPTFRALYAPSSTGYVSLLVYLLGPHIALPLSPFLYCLISFLPASHPEAYLFLLELFTALIPYVRLGTQAGSFTGVVDYILPVLVFSG